MESTVFGFRYSIYQFEDVIREKYGLSEDDFKDLSDMIDENVNSTMYIKVRTIFLQAFVCMYDFDHEALETDLSKQIFLKCKVELSHEERQRMLRFLLGYIAEFGESTLAQEILKEVSNTVKTLPKEMLEDGVFIPSVW